MLFHPLFLSLPIYLSSKFSFSSFYTFKAVQLHIIIYVY